MPSKNAEGLELSFHDLTISMTSGSLELHPRLLLNHVSGRIRAASLCAILGPSGSGKTTLLNALANRTSQSTPKTGTININGVTPSQSFFVNHTAYVPQQSILLPSMTPREAILFASKIRLPITTTKEQHESNVQTIIEQLSLQKCADTRIGDEIVGGISGGEKRRVNVGVEIVTKPAFLFADEPTTGLDSQTALVLMQSLKHLSSKSPVTVIASIHQPSPAMFELFDDLLLLSNGSIVYCGAASLALKYFETRNFICPLHTNPPEWFLDLLQRSNANDNKRLDTLIGYYKQEMEHTSYHHNGEKSAVLSATTSVRLPYFIQLYYLSQRSYLHVTRQPLLRVAQILQSVVLGLLVGLGFMNTTNTAIGIQDRFGCIYFVLIAVIFANCFAVVLTFAEESAVFIREQMNQAYSVSAYFVARTAVDILPQLVCSLLFTILSYFLMNFQVDFKKFIIFTVTVVMVAYIGSAIGLIVACAVSSRMHALMITPLLIAPFIIFTPYALPYNNCPPYFIWLQYMSPFWWSFSILCNNEFTGLTLTCLPSERISVPPIYGYDLGSVCFFTKGEAVLEHFSIDTSASAMNLWFGMLLLQVVLYRVFAFVLIYRSAKQVHSKL